jgi:hypothetical protein
MSKATKNSLMLIPPIPTTTAPIPPTVGIPIRTFGLRSEFNLAVDGAPR